MEVILNRNLNKADIKGPQKITDLIGFSIHGCNVHAKVHPEF